MNYNLKNILLYCLFFFILFTVTVNSQTTFGKATYSKTNYIPEFSKKNEKYNNVISDMQLGIYKTSKKLEFTLLFSNYESNFNLNKKLKLDKKDGFSKSAISMSGGKGNYYTNSKTKLFLHETKVGGQQFLIKESLDSVKWKLVNETKLIGKYLCYKATTIKINKRIKTYYKKVEAWYCPSLPYSFGPIGYGNLPGLILELKIEKGATFLVKKIIINPKEKIVIKKPSKGKKVNEKEFQESCKQMYYKRKQGL